MFAAAKSYFKLAADRQPWSLQEPLAGRKICQLAAHTVVMQPVASFFTPATDRQPWSLQDPPGGVFAIQNAFETCKYKNTLECFIYIKYTTAFFCTKTYYFMS